MDEGAEVVRWIQLETERGPLPRQQLAFTGIPGTNLHDVKWDYRVLAGRVAIVGFTLWDAETGGSQVSRPGSISAGPLIPEDGTLTFARGAVNVVDLFHPLLHR